MNSVLVRVTTALADRYRLERELGAGGMATVYLAHDLKHERDVAIKVLHPDLGAALGGERFLSEIRTTARLQHPHILPLLDSGEADGLLYYVMPLVTGETLRARLERERQLPIADAVRIAREVASALDYAHRHHVIHRDIKPENILLHDGHAIVADFGIARVVSSAGGERLTGTGMALGTPLYMSPEQSVGDDIDGRSDLYALGCVLYEMLAGEPPYTGATAQAIIAKRFRDPVPRVSTLRETVPPAVESALMIVLSKSPSDRFVTAEAFVSALNAEITSHAPRHPRVDDFRIAVQPFKYPTGHVDLAMLADGLADEIVTGLLRFPWLRVLARGADAALTRGDDLHAAGEARGARYVIQGSLRKAGTRLRVTVQLVDVASGVSLWAENYDRAFEADGAFELQDDLVPRIVSTCGDHFGVLARSICDAVRSREPNGLSPYEALMRGFGYHLRLTPEEHGAARDALEQAVSRAPMDADCIAMLSWVTSHEIAHGFNPRPGSLDRAVTLARRAVDLAPSNHLAHQALAVARFFNKETAGCLAAAERAIELNPLDGSNEAFFLICFTGHWDRGCALIRHAIELNPHHPRWYETILGLNEYRLGNYRAAADEAVRANVPEVFWNNILLVAALGQLEEIPGASYALATLLTQQAEFATSGEAILLGWFEPALVADIMVGLRKAGLEGGSRQ
ncbi:protein kinase domain-containing protein [Gemmatimonas sp.]|uniref:protein kinase domain-containing protein n=1 Tax=Gemmatimonas sp. TaxID=1962908 RepID=UPI003983C47A